MAEAVSEPQATAAKKVETPVADKANNVERSTDNGGNTDRKGRDRDAYDTHRRNNRGGGRGRGGGNRGRGGFGGFGGGGGRGRGRGRGNQGYNRSDNVRTNFERKEESNDTAQMRRQIEFYFSDSNLPGDKFLLEQTGGPENKPFPLETLHNFKRMRHFQPFSALVEAVKNSNLLNINEKNEITRKVPIDSKFTLDVKKNTELLTSYTMRRSLYAKGFGSEHPNLAHEIEEFVISTLNNLV